MLNECALRAGVGSCCQGRCYFQSIVSTSCGSGVIGVGCCRLYGVKRREGSQQRRKESGQTHSTTVAGNRLAYIASRAMFFPFIQTRFGLDGSR